ncbi:hypothetical protein D3C71_986850 [compost metagenome]
MIVFVILYVSFLLHFFSKKKQILSLKKTRALQSAHILMLLLVIAIIWMRTYGMSFRGYWTERTIWGVFYFSALSVLVSGSPDLVKGFRKFYYSLFLIFPISLVFLLLIPFLGVGTIFFIRNECIGDTSTIRYSDSKFRIELPYSGVLGARPEHGILIVKKGIFEYEDQVLDSINDNKVSVYRISIKSPQVILIKTLGKKNEKEYEVKNVEILLKNNVN